MGEMMAYGTADLGVMAKNVVASRLFESIKTEQAAFTLMMLCQSEGLHPMQAVRRFHIIDGKPSMRADAMLAEFQRQGGKVAWGERTDLAVEGTFSHPSGGSVTIRWDMDQARRAGLAGKNTWKSYPRQMMTARVISEGVRTVLPGVVVGIYTPEEVRDFDAPAPAPVRAIEPPPAPPEPTTIDVSPPPAPEPPPVQVDEEEFREFMDAVVNEWHAFDAVKGDSDRTAREHRVAHDLVSRAIKPAAEGEHRGDWGRVEEAKILAPNAKGELKRDPREVWGCVKWLFASDPAWCREMAGRHLNEVWERTNPPVAAN